MSAKLKPLFLSQRQVEQMLRPGNARKLIAPNKLKPVQKSARLHQFCRADVERAAENIRKGGAL